MKSLKSIQKTKVNLLNTQDLKQLKGGGDPPPVDNGTADF